MADCPYVGPRPFEKGEKSKFFGRDQEVRELRNLIVANRIVMLYSPSGAGKTSLVKAQLIPLFEAKTAGFRVFPVIRMTREPDKDCTWNRYSFSTLASLADPGFAALPTDGIVSRLESALSAGAKRALLIFDQFEEVLTLDPTDEPAKRAFFSELGEALSHPKVFALFSLREDYVAGLDPYLDLFASRLRTRFRIEPLRREAAISAMIEPARCAGEAPPGEASPAEPCQSVEFTRGAADKLADLLLQVRVQDRNGIRVAQGAFVEPVVLQVVCARLWHACKDRLRIGVGDIDDTESVERALVAFYDEKVALAAAKFKIGERVIRDWCGAVLITANGIRRQVLETPDVSEGLSNDVIGFLTAEHLLRAEDRRGVPWYELAHDRLVDPVRRGNAGWMESQGPLFRAADAWEKNGCHPSYLCGGQQFSELTKDGALSDPVVLRFIDACKAAEGTRAAKEAAERRRSRLITGSVTLSGALLGWIAIVLAILTTSYDPNWDDESDAVWRAAMVMFGLSVLGSVLAWLSLRQWRAADVVTQFDSALRRKFDLDRSLQSGRSTVPAPVVHSSPANELEPAERQALRLAPFWTFFALASREGGFPRDSSKSLMANLSRKASTQPAGSLTALLPASRESARTLLTEFLEDSRYALDGLRHVVAILETKASPQEATEFRSRLLRHTNADKDLPLATLLEHDRIPSQGPAYSPAEPAKSAALRRALIAAGSVIGFLLATTAATDAIAALASQALPHPLHADEYFALIEYFILLLPISLRVAVKFGKIRTPRHMVLFSVFATGLATLLYFWFASMSDDEEKLVGFDQWPVVAGFALFAAASGAFHRGHFCDRCNRWGLRQSARLQLSPKELTSLIETLAAPDAIVLKPLLADPTPVPEHWTLTLASCHKCAALHTLTISASAGAPLVSNLLISAQSAAKIQERLSWPKNPSITPTA